MLPMPYDPISRWENEGGAVLFANGAPHEPSREEGGEEELSRPYEEEASEHRDADTRPGRDGAG